ncbi:hypothetical protein [Reinekea sp. G2M2-21]|uniref:hypothetical protein n=1 Tax=Reinekea sp. G2M2-21 TaxID=2788942 RepID=UPI0018AB3DA0|nr:hypothetical protein [Reinekea sp. G2M2-21]
MPIKSAKADTTEQLFTPMSAMVFDWLVKKLGVTEIECTNVYQESDSYVFLPPFKRPRETIDVSQADQAAML